MLVAVVINYIVVTTGQTRRDRVGVVTVGHIPRELSWFVYYFLQVGGSVKNTVTSIQYWLSPIPEGGLEIPIQMTFSYTSKPLLQKMKLFAKSQLVKMDQFFRLEDDQENLDDDETEDIILDIDGD